MTDTKIEDPHILSTVAANIVSHMQDRPGTWDFQKAFKPYIRLMDLQSRLDENQLSATSAAANEARLLYLMKRASDLNEQIQALLLEIAALK
jgi:hypothetical protein